MAEKILLVLGASSEVGRKTIEAISENYSLIYAHYGHNAEELQELKSRIGDKLVLIQDDLMEENGGEKILSAIAADGRYPDHIFHCPAPKYENFKFQKAGWEPFEKGIQVSLRSAVVVLQPLLQKMVKEKREGRVVFVLSSVTNAMPPSYVSSYVTVKYALLGLMKSLSVEYASKNIMVNAVSPGMMETKFLENIPDLVVEQNAALSPFGRNLLVEEVVPAVEYLFSDGAARVTGQNLIISGGM